MIVPLIMRTTHEAIKMEAETKRYVARLHTQLLIDSAEDEKGYEDAFNKLKAEDEDATDRVLRGANDLAVRYKDNGEAGQMKVFESIDELHAGRFAVRALVRRTPPADTRKYTADPSQTHLK